MKAIFRAGEVYFRQLLLQDSRFLRSIIPRSHSHSHSLIPCSLKDSRLTMQIVSCKPAAVLGVMHFQVCLLQGACVLLF